MKIGIFGGTFDPIHNAHIAVALSARDTLALDLVLVIPAANPPHKSAAAASFTHRYRMVELAFQPFERLEPSLLEAKEERSYSIRTIEKVREIFEPSVELYFIIGADAFAEITTWHRWEDVIASVTFAVVTRPSSDYDIPRGAKVYELTDVMMPVSSSEIRDALARGEQPEALPCGVYSYIVANNLYS